MNKYETAARKVGVIEPAELKRGTVIFLECDNDLILELIATDPTRKTYTACANTGTLVRPQPVQILGSVEPGAERTILQGFIARDLRLALKIRGRLKVLPAVKQATIKGSNWSFDIWCDK